MSEVILEFEGVGKSFFGVPVLRDVGLRLQQGHVLGLVGENGAGKSTLMNILGGVIPADSGVIRLEGEAHAPRTPAEASRKGIAFIHQELNLFTNLSIAENLFITTFPKRRVGGIPFLDRRTIREKAKALLAAVDLSVSPDTLVEDLSPGERQLVEIAKALGADARIIIFDEPTTSLTSREAERLFGIIERLRAQSISMIYISHILGDVRRLCDDIVVLRDGRVVGTGAREEFSLEKTISLMVGRSIDQIYPLRATAPGEEPVLEARSVSQRGIVHDVSFVLHRGEVLGISGLMGSGRTELARIIFGLDPIESGEILLNGSPLGRSGPRGRVRRGMAFLTENRREEGLLMDASIADNIGLVSLPAFASSLAKRIDHVRLCNAAEEVAHSVRLQSMGITRQAAKTLSGGNQQKVVLAKWILAKPSAFILDEPTRGVDVGAKQEVYRIIADLAAGGAGILFISSEIEELIGMCDRILVMSGGEIRECIERGDFDRERILRAALRENASA